MWAMRSIPQRVLSFLPFTSRARFGNLVLASGVNLTTPEAGTPPGRTCKRRWGHLRRLDHLKGENATALAFSSGMAAVHCVTMMLSAGDHVIAGCDLYGGAYRLLHKICDRSASK